MTNKHEPTKGETHTHTPGGALSPDKSDANKAGATKSPQPVNNHTDTASGPKVKN